MVIVSTELICSWRLQHKKQIEQYDKREKQYHDVIDKYKAQHDSNKQYIADLESRLDVVSRCSTGAPLLDVAILH